MKARDYSRLMSELAEAYSNRCPASTTLHQQASRHLVDGGSHPLRLIQPFAPRIVSAQGGWMNDEDGHQILDFWQGHLANILGHNPSLVTSELASAFADGFGLQSGMTDRLQAEVAGILCRQTGADKVRLTTSGTLANMHAVILARAFTGRDLVMKAGGGWHGAHPWSLKGVRFAADGGVGFGEVDSEGLPATVTESVIVTSFNDPDRLNDDFARFGDRLACFVVEPLIGAGGLIPATREYLDLARRLTQQHGALLIFDEVVTGFRFRAGDLGALYRIAPDLAVYGKAIGGGMPVAALAGREEVMRLLGRAPRNRANLGGGTFCAHPSSMLAARVFMTYAVAHEGEIYPRLAALGESMRSAMVSGFSDGGVLASCTGTGPDLPTGSSLCMLHFPFEEGATFDTPRSVFDPKVCDIGLRTAVLGLAMLLEDVHIVQGHGAAATTHTDEDMATLKEVCRRVAHRVKPYL